MLGKPGSLLATLRNTTAYPDAPSRQELTRCQQNKRSPSVNSEQTRFHTSRDFFAKEQRHVRGIQTNAFLHPTRAHILAPTLLLRGPGHPLPYYEVLL